MAMTKEMMRESIASALTKVQETGQWQEATLPEDNEDENELVMLAAHDGKIEMHAGWNEHEMELVYASERATFDVDAAIAAAWPDMG